MTSKEALERYYSNLLYGNGGFQTDQEELDGLNAIKQDIKKLEQYKQLEEKLGIDLFILFGALRNGIYYKSFNGDIDYLSNRVLTLSYSYGFDIWVEGHRKFDGLLIDFKYYGKTWSLGKEDLEDDK